MMHVTYIRYEILRSFRNWRFLILTLAIPIVLYYSVASAEKSHPLQGIAFNIAFMSSMATLGAMSAVISSGIVISGERSMGWTRQMRITPLGTPTYLGTKVLVCYLRAILVIAAMCVAGITLGVHLPAHDWAVMIGLLLAGIVPFTVLGILLGHLLTTDSATIALSGTVMIFGLLGGAYGIQLASSGILFDIIKGIPSFWLAQAGKAALRLDNWPAEGWIVMGVWTAVLLPLAVLAYQRGAHRQLSI
jgi:ABC-2 type transport system permease protein